jgi:hypothetical protein
MAIPDSAHTSRHDATDLSLIICTRNRAFALAQCLSDLDTAEINEVYGEVVLVDNGSSDGTPRVMRRFAEEAPCRVTIVVEPGAGLSRARNAGLARAQGSTIVFTDDDCYLGPGYFRVAHTVFDGSPFSYCGGRILLHDSADAAYGLSESDTFERVPPRTFIPPGQFQGANLVVHRRVFDQIGTFDVELGAGTPFRCEDVDFVARASQAGFAGAHVPELVVYHHHGRKPGQEIERLKRKNAYARGAYYAKFLAAGYLSFAWHWVRRSLLRRRSLVRTWPAFTREVRGAIDYWAR